MRRRIVVWYTTFKVAAGQAGAYYNNYSDLVQMPVGDVHYAWGL